MTYDMVVPNFLKELMDRYSVSIPVTEEKVPKHVYEVDYSTMVHYVVNVLADDADQAVDIADQLIEEGIVNPAEDLSEYLSSPHNYDYVEHSDLGTKEEFEEFYDDVLYDAEQYQTCEEEQ